MCGGFFIPEITTIRTDLAQIFAYEIGIIISNNISSQNGFTNGVPAIEFDKIDPAEQALIDCFIDNRSGLALTILNKLHKANRKIAFEAANLPAGDLASEELVGYVHEIKLDRTQIRSTAVDRSSSDTAAEEDILFTKLYVEMVVHEICHADGKDHPANSIPTSLEYFDSDNGACTKAIYKQVFDDKRPLELSTFQLPQDYSWNLSCMTSAITSNPVYFQSMGSAAAASVIYPTYDVEYFHHAK